MNKLKQLWDNLRSSFWFVPSLILAFSIALAMTLVQVHSTASSQWLARWPRLFGASVKGSREILSTIAGSMMTVVGVTFSMTLVALVLASSQYTSRILRNFMGDRVTQVVLGVFSGIFAYCLIILRTIRSGDEGGFVPSLAVFFAMVLAMSGIGVLIFFIHHIAASIQASSIIATVADETITAVMCLNYLTAILARLASRGIPSSRRYEDGELRIRPEQLSSPFPDPSPHIPYTYCT